MTYKWIYGGVRVMVDPERDRGDWTTEDIARSLAKLARWTGHTDDEEIYSVAQHCVMVSYLLEPHELGLEGLLHDAHEFVLGDVSSPLKKELDCGRLRELAHGWDRVIGRRYGANFEGNSHLIKYADRLAQRWEARYIMNVPPDEWRSFCAETDGWGQFGELYEKTPTDWEANLPASVADLMMPCPVWVAERRFLTRLKQLRKVH